WYLTIGGKERHWPTFNLADAALTVGVAMILVDMLFLDRRQAPQE
ncbi:MAG: signal peptidase II, partial [Deltaproteobacteria bacterium]